MRDVSTPLPLSHHLMNSPLRSTVPLDQSAATHQAGQELRLKAITDHMGVSPPHHTVPNFGSPVIESNHTTACHEGASQYPPKKLANRLHMDIQSGFA